MDIHRVLFPTDFSASAEAAGRVAVDMARQWGATLHVVHVVPPVTDAANAADRLSRAAQSLAPGPAPETALLSGRAAREIVAYARDKHVDLIVLGSHGRTGVSRAILGSVAEGVVRLASCLVLTVPAGAAVLKGAASAPVEAPAHPSPRCLVCAEGTDTLICEPCRTKIRGEALEQKLEAERAGRRGSAT
ncbi:MAG: universal stress protein [Candidatus Rokubacteria bacterium]|nr:universal stress protein [Candidatus Rokubacteria bacterium]